MFFMLNIIYGVETQKIAEMHKRSVFVKCVDEL